MVFASSHNSRIGAALVAGSALTWSFGGTIARFIGETDSWAVVFWRAFFATAFLFGFLVVRDGFAATLRAFRGMGLAGLAVAICFAIASTCFIIALRYTTVANILLMQAGGPLMAALMSWLIFGEKIAGRTWVAIAAVIAGVAIMVSHSLTGEVSPIGDGLSLLIAVVFATATVITRRNASIRMTPAVCLGTAIACCAAALLTSHYAVKPTDFAWLVVFGALNLGAGLALFTMGARLIAAEVASLIGVLETVFGPIWVWLVHNEVPHTRTLIGGGLVALALFIHLLLDLRRKQVA